MNENSPKTLAYRIATALQKKLSPLEVGVRIETMHMDRLLIEYTLADDRRQVGVAYTESYFESNEKDHVQWFAKLIYVGLTQALEWAKRPHYVTKELNPTHVGGSNQRPNDTKVSSTSIVQNRRHKGDASKRKASLSDDDSDTQPIHTEDVPAGLF